MARARWRCLALPSRGFKPNADSWWCLACLSFRGAGGLGEGTARVRVRWWCLDLCFSLALSWSPRSGRQRLAAGPGGRPSNADVGGGGGSRGLPCRGFPEGPRMGQVEAAVPRPLLAGTSHIRAARGVWPALAFLLAGGLGEKTCTVRVRWRRPVLAFSPALSWSPRSGKKTVSGPLWAGSPTLGTGGAETSVAFPGRQYPGMARVTCGASWSSPPLRASGSPRGGQRPAAGGGRRHSRTLDDRGEWSLPRLSPGAVDPCSRESLSGAGGRWHLPAPPPPLTDPDPQAAPAEASPGASERLHGGPALPVLRPSEHLLRTLPSRSHAGPRACRPPPPHPGGDGRARLSAVPGTVAVGPPLLR